MKLITFVLLSSVGLVIAGENLPSKVERGALAFQNAPGGRWQFGGIISNRLQVNIDNWLLRAPEANPGMTEMFRVRDREPEPKLVPWAGEFVGKYLISAIQHLRLTQDPRLRKTVEDVVADLISTQSPEGYLGPFPKAARLRGNWDLWGHYHCMKALIMWREFSGSQPAWEAALKAADFICDTFLDGKLRVKDAGSPEMNMAVIHVMAELHRLTGNERYLKMAREIENDWEGAGDYLRKGVAGVEFYKIPSPRWESLHDLEGLFEMYRITGEEQYSKALISHWRSIATNDVHNTGGFSTGEQATGNAFAPGAIETCCTIAWMAYTLDYLRLTGDAHAADYFELALYNGALGAQHPSGRWWTYNTPMDGAREASAHTIVFQSRAGTPELNCCSVNASRSLGMISEWALLSDKDGAALNFYGPGKFEWDLPQGKLGIENSGNYPFTNAALIHLTSAPKEKLALKLRMPGWSKNPRCVVNGKEIPQVKPGEYLRIDRKWKRGDRIELNFGEPIHFARGDREQKGKASAYYGPVLLAWDQALNGFDESAVPGINAEDSAKWTVSAAHNAARPLEPWLSVTAPGAGGTNVVLCDFASAGARGTRYRSWLPLTNLHP
jgi:DUF1680 family protein